VRPVALTDASFTESALLERAADLAALGASLDAARRRSRGRVMLVSGEAGVGKTALLRRFCAECVPSVRSCVGAAIHCSRRVRSVRC
jgi:Cdc6-like AAA superfamily ATPase